MVSGVELCRLWASLPQRQDRRDIKPGVDWDEGTEGGSFGCGLVAWVRDAGAGGGL